MMAAWEALPAAERAWLQAQNAALAMQPGTEEAEEEQQRLLQQCAEAWNAFLPVSQWRTAWADLLPQLQQDTLEQHGVSTVEEVLPAISAEFTSVPEDLRTATLQQLPPPVARLLVAAANMKEQLARKAAWAALEPHERRWLEDQEAAAAAAAAVQPDSEEAAEQLQQRLQQLAEEWYAFPPESRWRTAWADLIPTQQQQMLAQVGAASVEEFVPATAAALAAVPPDQQAAVMGGLPLPQQRVIAAAAGLHQHQGWQQEAAQQRAAWEGMAPDELLWLQNLTTALSAQPSTQQEAQQQAAALAQLGQQWNSFQPTKQWSTAWANLLPSQQRQLVGKYGAADELALLPALAAAYAGVEPSQRGAWLTQLPSPEAQLLVAAANVQKQAAAVRAELAEREAGWAPLGDDERQWLQAQQVVLAAAPQSEADAAQQGRALQNLIEQWNAWPADKQWVTAWADLLPSQKRYVLAKYGVDGPLPLRAAAGKLFGALPEEERKKKQSGLPPFEERIVVAASNWQRAQQR